ncbi:MAG: DNA primase [Pseudomonadota bacterium]
MSADALLSRLDGIRRTGQDRGVARCSAHADKRASLSWRELDDGRVLLHCFAGCSTEEVLSAIGLTFDALYPERPTDDNPRKHIQKPWRASDVVRALGFELEVAWIILADVSKGKPVSEIDRQRASACVTRIQRFIQELDYAH